MGSFALNLSYRSGKLIWKTDLKQYLCECGRLYVAHVNDEFWDIVNNFVWNLSEQEYLAMLQYPEVISSLLFTESTPKDQQSHNSGTNTQDT